MIDFMEKKYVILTDDYIREEHNGEVYKLHRIVALRDIPSINVSAGNFGGYVENESNLSHDGDCWIGGDSKVCGGSVVRDNATVFGNATVIGSGVYDNSCVFGMSTVINSRVICNAYVGGDCIVKHSTITSNSKLFDGKILSTDDVICVGPFICEYDVYDYQVRNYFVTLNKNSKRVAMGHFFGSLEDFEKQHDFREKDDLVRFFRSVLENE